MSVKLTALAFEIEDLPAEEKLVLLSMADDADSFDFCRSSPAETSEKIKLPETSVQSSIENLKSRGLLTSHPPGIVQAGTMTFEVWTDYYRIHLSDVFQLA